MTIRMIYTTCKGRKEAEHITKHLLKEKLAVCGNHFPIHSIYLWKGKPKKANETVLLIKTNRSFSTMKKAIEKLHSYSTPCILEIDIDGVNSSYRQWVGKELKPNVSHRRTGKKARSRTV